ncbi:hypothetical protein HK097_010977, partial [Rhizophlyctis rosea]
MRALGRKTLSYQKRQWFTNICCVSCCPLAMVVISAGLGVFVQVLVDRQTNPRDYVFCSNLTALEDSNFPITNVDDTRLPFGPLPSFKIDNATHTNFLVPPNSFSVGVGSAQPCVKRFTSYSPYTNDSPYSQDPQIRANESWYSLDSTFSPPPKGGWLNPQGAASQLSRYLIQWQLRPWYLYAVADGVNPADIGSRPATAGLSLQRPQDLLPLFTNGGSSAVGGGTVTNGGSTIGVPFKPAGQAGGLLGTMEGRLTLETTDGQMNLQNAVLTSVPYFNSSTAKTPNDLDDAIAGSIKGVIEELKTIDKHVLQLRDPTPAEYQGFLMNASLVVRKMPYGAVLFEEINHAAKRYKYTFSIASDPRLGAASGFPSQGTRQIYLQSQLSNAILRFSNTTSLGSTVIAQSTRAMPSVTSTKLELPIASFIGRILFPFGLSFLLPIFVITVVKEKEERIMIMMQMNGMKQFTYWVTHYIHFYSLHVISSAVFLIVGFGARLDMFRKTEVGVLLAVFFMWGHVQVALALFFATFFSKARTALVLVFLIVLCGVIVSLAMDTLFPIGDAPPAYFIWPPFAFYRILTVLNTAAFSRRLRPYTVSMIRPGDEIFTALMFLVGETVVFLLLTGYIQTIVPSEFGVARKWYWPFQSLARLFGANKKLVTTTTKPTGKVHDEDVETSASELTMEDADVKAERARVVANNFDPNSPVIMKHMRKVYPSRSGLGPKIAVKDVTLAVEEGIVFGLLGPNGAGKTTLISILTGLYDASGGVAKLAGFDIGEERESVYRVIGICPQHDILWDDLTVEEHLLFYARLKGVPVAEEKEAVQTSMATVSLDGPFASRLSKGLSGGEKRRLSIAIALVGSPSVVFLDEPTTGLDPEVRRLVWDIVGRAREGKTIILTTHSMEEAEVLCQRIGIMAKGTLRCLGAPLHLKNLYGSGFRVSFSTISPEASTTACQFIESVLPPPPRTKKVDSFATNVTYEFENEPGLVGRVFEEVERGKEGGKCKVEVKNVAADSVLPFLVTDLPGDQPNTRFNRAMLQAIWVAGSYEVLRDSKSQQRQQQLLGVEERMEDTISEMRVGTEIVHIGDRIRCMRRIRYHRDRDGVNIHELRRAGPVKFLEITKIEREGEHLWVYGYPVGDVAGAADTEVGLKRVHVEDVAGR